MKLLILTDDGQTVLYALESVNHAPYGIETVPEGIAISPALRGELTKFFYENPRDDAPTPQQGTYGPLTYIRGNFVVPKVVQFKRRS